MNFAMKFARALVPVALIAAPVAVQAKLSPGLAEFQAHLNAVQTMTANFTQTDAKGQTLTGSLKLKKPGHIRFQYGGGANMLLVADGQKLTFIDYDVGQKNSWELDRTPLGILLQDHPDVSHAATVQPSTSPNVLVIQAKDPRHPYIGSLVLAFIRDSAAPGGLMLYGWTAIDAQHKRTTVRLSDQKYNVPVSDSVFAYVEPKKRGR
jgi:outer membrane lipoprotein-sorting protein